MREIAKCAEDSVGSYNAAAESAMRKIARVPGTYRNFTVSAADATRVQHIEPGLLELVLDLGLPHSGSGRERRFDRLDLENLGIELQLPCPRWTAMRWWSRVLPSRVTPGPTAWTMTLKADCPTPAQAHDCQVTYHPGVVSASEPDEVHCESAVEYPIELTTHWVDHCFGEQFNALIEQILPVEFHLLPNQLTKDTAFVAHTGLAECRLATSFLVRAAAELGLPVRPVSGFFLARPFSIRHWWVEFREGGTWLAADPFLLSTFLRWGLANQEAWPVNRSPGGVLWPDAVSGRRLATHGGVPVKAVTMISAPRPLPPDRQRARGEAS